MTLYELSGDYKTLEQMAEATDDPAELQMFGDTLEGLKGEIQSKIVDCAKVVKNLEAHRDAAAVERKRLAAREKAFDNAVDRLKAYMQAGMESAGIDQIKVPLFTVAIQNNPPKVAIDDEAAVLPEFKKIVTSIQTAEIAKALKAGVPVVGAHLEQTRSLRIR